MNVVLYLVVSSYGFGLIINGYKEFRDKQYKTFFKPNIFRRATKIVVEGQRAIPMSIWHMLAGALIIITSLFMLIQNKQNALGFIFVWVFVYGIIEAIVGSLSIGSLRGYYQQSRSKDPTTKQNSQE